jgi:hypothetical protein
LSLTRLLYATARPGSRIGGINCHTIASYGSPNTFFQITSTPFNQGNSRRHTDSLVSACFHCNLAKTPPHRAATRSHQPAIDLRSHHVFLPLVTRTPITAGGYLGLITSPHKIHRSISRASRKPPHGRAQSQITWSRSHRSISREFLTRFYGVYLGLITSVLTRSRRDTGSGMRSSYFTNISVSACSYYHNAYK